MQATLPIAKAIVNPSFVSPESLYDVRLEKLWIELKEVFSGEDVKWSAEILRKAIDETVPKTVTTEPSALYGAFSDSMLRFYGYMFIISMVLNAPILLLEEDELRGVVEKLKELEEKLYRLISSELRSRGRSIIGDDVENAVYALSMLFDYDIWALEKVRKYGTLGLLYRLTSRAG